MHSENRGAIPRRSTKDIMHEQSETIKRNGKWINVYGRSLSKAGQQLPGTSEYNTMEEAVKAAKERSENTDPKTLKPYPKLQLQKYSGPKDPAQESAYIAINRTKALIEEAKKRKTIVSGEGDPFIQSTPTGEIVSAPKGKYFGRPVTREGKAAMAFDSSAFERLSSLAGVLTRDKQNKEMIKGITPEEHQARLVASIPFATAISRQSIWKKVTDERNGIIPLPDPSLIERKGPVQFAQIGFGGGGNVHANEMFKELDQAPPTIFDKSKANVSESTVGSKTRSVNLEELAEADRSRAKKFADLEAQDKANQARDLAAQKKRNRKLLGLE